MLMTKEMRMTTATTMIFIVSGSKIASRVAPKATTTNSKETRHCSVMLTAIQTAGEASNTASLVIKAAVSRTASKCEK